MAIMEVTYEHTLNLRTITRLDRLVGTPKIFI